ncbi:MAG: hypothetical protein JXK07_16745 [Spirochaetes bacterium]|nr:hypothetical protein [Spirochaetota bacterium]MBN2772133.1 hypothetical protein [Spirochaetota bacterium]
MEECKNLEKCNFFKTYENDSKRKLSLEGFVYTYCRGEKMNECKRLKMCDALGKENVPKNMMPNGLPLSGTDKSDWSEKVLELL